MVAQVRNGYQKVPTVERDPDSCRRRAYEDNIFRNHARGRSGLDLETTRLALGELMLEKAAGVEGQAGWTQFLQECDLDSNCEIDAVEFRLIVDRLLIKEAMKFTKEAKQKKNKLRDALNNWDKAVIAAKELRQCWEKASGPKFLRWFEAMEDPEMFESRLEMLESLVFTVPCRKGGKWQEGVGNRCFVSFGKFKGDVMANDTALVYDSPMEFPLPKEAKKKVNPKDIINFKRTVDPFQNFILRRKEEKYCLAYTTARFLFDPEHLPNIVHAIENASVRSGVFNSPTVHAILVVGWHRSQGAFYFNIIVDLVVIIILARIAGNARKRLVVCQFTVALLAICSTYHIVGDLLEFLGPLLKGELTCRQFWMRIFGSFWAFFEMMLSMYFFVLVMLGLTFHKNDIMSGGVFEPRKAEWLHHHPIWVAMLLAAKTSHLIVRLLCVRALGQHIVPAYHAVKHASSKAFLLFLLLMFINAVLTLHAVPIQFYNPKDDERRWWDDLEELFDTSVLQFNTVFLGETSPDELEQENKEIALSQRLDDGAPPLAPPMAMGMTRPPLVLAGELTGPSTHGKYHHGVQLLNVGFIILVHIIMLNVYISVLGNKYEKAVAKKLEHFEKFRAVFTRKTLTRWQWCMKRQGSGTSWIAYKERLSAAPSDRRLP